MASETPACFTCNNLKNILNIKENEIMKLRLNIQTLIKYIDENCRCNLQQLEFFREIKCIIEEWDNAIGTASNNLDVTDNILNSSEEYKQTQITNIGDSKNFSDVKEVENETNVSQYESNQDYVFDEKYQMYYSLSTGYYYDEKRALLYEPQSSIYYKYDYEKNEYYKVECDEIVSTSNNNITSMCEAVADKVNDLNLNDDSTKSDSQSNEVSKNENSLAYLTAKNENSNMPDAIHDDDALSSPTNDWQPKEGSNMTVADMVKQVVDEQSNMSDYIYDELHRMYYSPSTGYYFDAVRNLLYDPSNGIYYFYNAEKESYEFYCQTTPTVESISSTYQDDINREKLKSRNKYWRKKLNEAKNSPETVNGDDNNKSASENPEEEFSSPEDGEIFSSDDESNLPISITRSPVKESHDKNSENFCPSSIRAIVENSENLKIGSLVLITYPGGIVGRDQASDVFLPDICVSKTHAEIKYNPETQTYTVEDLGSQNGTFVNDQRLSGAKERSEMCLLNHGDKLAFGSCKLLVHIHDGLETCDCCEPGQVLAEIVSQTEKNIMILSKEEKEKNRREELRRLKMKYGLKSAAFERNTHLISKEYEDKAEIRRQCVGSDNPYEKTEEASLHVSMQETNKGYQMLKKMGWKEGEALGAANSGLLEPIPLRAWVSKAGLGSNQELPSSENNPENRRKKKWVKAQERYFQLSLKNAS